MEKQEIKTKFEDARKVAEGIYKGKVTGTLYNSEGRILTRSVPLFTTADAQAINFNPTGRR